MIQLLKLLEQDCTLTNSQLASMLETTEEEVAAERQRYTEAGVIMGYKAVINWERTKDETVSALIDVHVTPQRGQGFDRVAERIYQFDEVESLELMSGGYDLSVLIRGRTMKEVALFVAQKLAPIEGVTGTATHFLLKKYKERGIIFEEREEQQERIEMV